MSKWQLKFIKEWWLHEFFQDSISEDFADISKNLKFSNFFLLCLNIFFNLWLNDYHYSMSLLKGLFFELKRF